MTNNSSSFPSLEYPLVIDLCVGMEFGIYIWGIFSIICSAVGLPATFAILWEMYKAYKDRTLVNSINLFILNLSIVDAGFLFTLPLAVATVFISHSRLVSSMTTALYALNLCGRPLMMACICLDYYAAVVHPVFYRRMKSVTPRALAVAGVWTVTLVSAGLYFHYQWLYFTLYSTAYYIIGMVVIGVCDAFILRALVAPANGGKGVHPQKKKAIQIVTNSLVMVGISYLPPTVIFIFGLSLTSDMQHFICTAGIPVSLTSTLGSTIMPVLHLGNIGKFDWLRLRCSK